MLFDFYNYQTIKKDMNLYDDYEGFIKGNCFPNLYNEYKNYTPKEIKTNNEREAMLLKIMMLDFAINDINIYLAINPDDTNMYEKYKEYILELNKLNKIYQDKYEVLEVCSDTKGKYTWGNNPWPWDGDKYV